MFDKLIVSEPENSDLKNMRRYFAVSSVVVGILFGTAVLFSIFAADYRLGASEFELVELIAPPNMMATAPEPPRLQIRTQTASALSPSTLPGRKDPVERVADSTKVPTGISAVRNTSMEVPKGLYELKGIDTNPGPGGSGRDGEGSGDGPSGLTASASQAEEIKALPEPPPIREPVPARASPPRSIGVVNGIATNLPIPVYPAAAKAVNIQGKVNVQVLIDETGRVVSAKAVNGNALLQAAAVAAARNARFTPTLLSKVPVKVTGVIVYNFTRS